MAELVDALEHRQSRVGGELHLPGKTPLDVEEHGLLGSSMEGQDSAAGRPTAPALPGILRVLLLLPEHEWNPISRQIQKTAPLGFLYTI